MATGPTGRPNYHLFVGPRGPIGPSGTYVLVTGSAGPTGATGIMGDTIRVAGPTGPGMPNTGPTGPSPFLPGFTGCNAYVGSLLVLPTGASIPTVVATGNFWVTQGPAVASTVATGGGTGPATQCYYAVLDGNIPIPAMAGSSAVTGIMVIDIDFPFAQSMSAGFVPVNTVIQYRDFYGPVGAQLISYFVQDRTIGIYFVPFDGSDPRSFRFEYLMNPTGDYFANNIYVHGFIPSLIFQ